jgi:uncharacterized protein
MTNNDNGYALITGGSKGIGKAIAEELAKRFYNLLLIARSEPELSDLANELAHVYGVKVHYLAADLSLSNSASTIFDWIVSNDFSIEILVNNAGYGVWGNFNERSLKEQLEMLQVNINALVELTYLLLPMLEKAKQSYLLNIASTAAYQAVPTLALYAASKAFVLSFTRAIRYELRNSHVSVTCFSPGPVATNFAHRAGLNALSKMAQKFNMQADHVAKIAVKAMFNKKSEAIPGITNLISVYANRVLPKSFIERTAANIYKT